MKKRQIDEGELGSNLGYLLVDNAESNDSCLEVLSRLLSMYVDRRLLRRIGHVINLVVRAVIFRLNVSAFEAELRGAADELFAMSGRRKEPSEIVITWLPTFGGQRRQAFRCLQTELFAADERIFTLKIVVDGKTRWNSIDK